MADRSTHTDGAEQEVAGGRTTRREIIKRAGAGTILVVYGGALPKTAAAGVPKYRASCLLYTSPSPRDRTRSRMPSSA